MQCIRIKCNDVSTEIVRVFTFMNYGFVSFDTPRLPCLCVVLRYVSLSSLLMRCTKYYFRVLLCTYVHTKTDERSMQARSVCVSKIILDLL